MTKIWEKKNTTPYLCAYNYLKRHKRSFGKLLDLALVLANNTETKVFMTETFCHYLWGSNVISTSIPTSETHENDTLFPKQ